MRAENHHVGVTSGKRTSFSPIRTHLRQMTHSVRIVSEVKAINYFIFKRVHADLLIPNLYEKVQCVR